MKEYRNSIPRLFAGANYLACLKAAKLCNQKTFNIWFAKTLALANKNKDQRILEAAAYFLNDKEADIEGLLQTAIQLKNIDLVVKIYEKRNLAAPEEEAKQLILELFQDSRYQSGEQAGLALNLPYQWIYEEMRRIAIEKGSFPAVQLAAEKLKLPIKAAEWKEIIAHKLACFRFKEAQRAKAAWKPNQPNLSFTELATAINRALAANEVLAAFKGLRFLPRRQLKEYEKLVIKVAGLCQIKVHQRKAQEAVAMLGPKSRSQTAETYLNSAFKEPGKANSEYLFTYFLFLLPRKRGEYLFNLIAMLLLKKEYKICLKAIEETAASKTTRLMLDKLIRHQIDNKVPAAEIALSVNASEETREKWGKVFL